MNTEPRLFEDKLLTIDMIDGLRREQERFDAALGDAERMQSLRAEIQAYYAQAGITVPDALIDQAIAERQAQRFAFRPASLGVFGHVVASLYVLRARIVAATLLLLTAGVVGWLADSQYRQWQQQRALQAYRNDLLQQLADVQQNQAQIDALPATLPPLESSQIPALPTWVSDLQSDYSQTMLTLGDAQACQRISLPADLDLAWSGEAELQRCHGQLPAVQRATEYARQLQNEHQVLTTAATRYTLWQQRMTGNALLQEWNALVVANNALQTAIAPGASRAGFITAMNAATAMLDELSLVLDTHASTLSCLSTAVTRATDVNDLRTLKTMLDDGQAFKQASSVTGIATWTAHAADSCEFFGQAVQLRIVNESSEQTGVWRYYDGNRSARTYYLIVDAVNSAGVPLEVPFDSLEDNRAYKQRRFGVRVSEQLFEQVRDDKADDGLLRTPQLGGKPANSLTWQLADGADAGFIAEW